LINNQPNCSHSTNPTTPPSFMFLEFCGTLHTVFSHTIPDCFPSTSSVILRDPDESHESSRVPSCHEHRDFNKGVQSPEISGFFAEVAVTHRCLVEFKKKG
jgi:hypothetical protein